MSDSDWERGDLLGLDFPVHIEALRSGGPCFLTKAFREAGAIDDDNSVVAITELEPVSGGSTGRKAVLSVSYARPEPGLPERLFVKFSRDLDNSMRDHGRWQMQSEARFGLLSSVRDLPVAVPRCLFGEYNTQSGSGVLVSEKISFGTNGIEPHHAKARDYELDDVRDHYAALVSTVARLAGTHRAGRLPPEVDAQFPARSSDGRSSRQAPYSTQELDDRIARYEGFANRFRSSFRPRSNPMPSSTTWHPRGVAPSNTLRPSERHAKTGMAGCSRSATGTRTSTMHGSGATEWARSSAG